jgi:hypothetical protein
MLKNVKYIVKFAEERFKTQFSWGTRVLENDEENVNPFVPINELRMVLQVIYKGETYT